MLVLEQFVAAVQARLIAVNCCAGRVEKNAGMPTDDATLPFADIFVAKDSAVPDGDSRTGYPKFIHTTKLVVEITDKANDGPELKTKLATHGELVLAALLSDLRWGDPVLEGIAGVDQTYNQPPDGNHTLGAVQIQIDLLWRSAWPPITSTLPSFAGVTINAGNGIGATVPVPTT